MQYAMQFGRGLDERARRPLRRHVRQRADRGLRRRGPPGGRGAARPRRGDRRLRASRRAQLRLRSDAARRRPLGRAHAGRPLRRRARRACAPTTSRPSRSPRRSSAPASPRDEIEDVYLGCANQAGEDNRNVARMAVLLAGLPESVAGVTLNRLCASGLAAVVSACHAVAAGDGDLFVAGGVESMSRAPLVDGEAGHGVPARQPDGLGHDARLALPEPAARGDVPARVDGRDGRERRRALGRLARGSGRVRARVAAALGRGRGGRALRRRARRRSATSTRDEHPRPDTSAEKLAALKPAFRASGTVTAGNSSGINDGAAALVIASEEKARELGAEPLGAFVGSAVAGVDPRVMGIGPVPAVRKLLDADRRRRRRARPRRAERGVRVAVARRHPRARPRSGEGERERRRDRARPSARHERARASS